MDFFKRLHKRYHFTDPVEHIIGRQICTVWTKFKETHNLKCQFHEDLRDIDLSKDIMCLWFFRERADRDAGNDLKLSGNIVTYSANTIFITPSKEIRIKERKKFFPRRPCVQIDISNETYLNIKKELGINE
jgi:hypothetical protein